VARIDELHGEEGNDLLIGGRPRRLDGGQQRPMAGGAEGDLTFDHDSAKDRIVELAIVGDGDDVV
jgi:hypothetical protein